MRYARIHHQAGDSPDIGEALEKNPLAVSLFFIGLSRADLYGILPGEARRYRAIVAPAAILSAETVEEAIQEQERRGWVRRYTDSEGTSLLHVLNYHQYQEVRWANGVAPPDHELPEWWQAPLEFQAWLASERCSTTRKHSAQWAALRERYCSTTVVLQEHYPTQDTEHKTQDTENDHDSLPLTAVPSEEGAVSVTSAAANGKESVPPVGPDSNGDATDSSPSPARPRKSLPADELTIAAACNRLTGSLHPQRDRWREALLEAARDPNTPLNDDEIVEALEHQGPSVADTPQTWLRRTIARKTQQQRGASSRASPRRLAPRPPSDPSKPRRVDPQYGQLIANKP